MPMAPHGISVIIPAFNAAATIGETLSSALAQTRPPMEIIVVDDGSHDDTAAIVARMAAAHPRIKLLRQANAGQILARNAAIAASRGDFIAPLDADDLWHPRYLEKVTAALERGGDDTGFAYSLYRMIDGEGRALFDGHDFNCEGWTIMRHLFVNFVGNGSCAVYRRDALLAAGLYPLDAIGWHGAEDYLLQLRVAARHRVARVGEYLVGYRRSAGSYSMLAPKAAHRARIQAVATVCREFGLACPDAVHWANADGLRVHAALRAMQGRWPSALRLGLRALMLDPAGTAVDLLARTRNALQRLTPGSRKPAEANAIFLSLDPGKPMSARINRLTGRRLARLALGETGPVERVEQGRDPARGILGRK